MNNETGNSTQALAIPPIWFLALCTASAVIGMTVLTPALPLIKTEFSASSESVQMLLTAYLFALAFGQLLWGPISDRTGRRPVLLSGAVLFCVASIFTMLTKDIDLLIGLRFIQGLGAAACMAMGRAIVNDVFKREDAAKKMSTISTVLAIAPALSLAFGGVLAESAGWIGIMGLLAVAAIIVVISAYFLATETNHHRLDTLDLKTMLNAYASVLTNKLFLLWTIAGGMQVGIFFSLNAFLAYQYQRNGYSMIEFGLWFALTPIAYIVGNTCNRYWFVSRGLERAALTGCILSFVSVVMMLITQSLGWTHALSLALPSVLFGFANGIVIANATVGAQSAAGHFAGTGTGINGAWQMASGGIAGAIIVALGGDSIFSVAIGVLIIMGAIAVGAMLMLIRENRLVASLA